MSHVTVNVTSCPPPFVDASLYPPFGGEISARFCADPIPGLTCCLPCPISQWVFDSAFDHQAPAANYVSIGSFVLNSLMLITYIVLPEEKSHRHYLSIGLTLSLLLLSIAFIIPLSTKPELCYNEITPNNMHSDLSCAWSGALLLVGAMGAVVWILLRSIWTFLRIVFDFKRTDLFKYISLTLGIGVPVLFLAVAMPITGVSYRLYNVCIPNGQKAFISWFIWLLVFAGVSVIILVLTIVYCLFKFSVSALAAAGGTTGATSNLSTRSEDNTGDSAALAATTGDVAEKNPKRRKRAARRRKRIEWARIKRVLYLQWRTILLAFIVLNETIFFGLVFVQQTAALEASSHGITTADQAWGECLIRTGGDKSACLDLSGGLGLSEPRVVATLLLAASLGPLVFLLMLRYSMLQGWYELLRNPSQLKRRILSFFHPRRPSVGSQDFIMQGSPKHLSLNRPLDSEFPAPLQSPNQATRQLLGLDGHMRGDSVATRTTMETQEERRARGEEGMHEVGLDGDKEKREKVDEGERRVRHDDEAMV